MDTATQHYPKHVSVPSGEGVRVDKSITIHRPVSEVYQFWRRLENLPRFMHRLRSVTVKDHLHSHWVAQPVSGKELEWDAEIIEQRENEMISWRSAPGADVNNAGSVWFTHMPDGRSTNVRVEMKYVPPGGAAGALVAKAVDHDPSAELDQDLHRLKSLLETGTLPAPSKAPVLRRVLAAGSNQIRQNPWRSIGTLLVSGFVLGLTLGLVLRSSRSRRTLPLPRRIIGDLSRRC